MSDVQSNNPSVVIIKEGNGFLHSMGCLGVLVLLCLAAAVGLGLDAPQGTTEALDYANVPARLVTWPVEMPAAQRPVGAGVDPQVAHWEKGVGGVDLSYPVDWPQMSREDQNKWLATRDARLEALNR